MALSVDTSGQVVYWGGPKQDYKMPKCATFDSIMDTDLFVFMTVSTHSMSRCIFRIVV